MKEELKQFYLQAYQCSMGAPFLTRHQVDRRVDPKLCSCELADNDILNRIPNKETTLDIMVITKLLSTRATKSLGDFESQFMFHPACVQAAQEFREELAQISRQIKLRNRCQAFPYDWLDPEYIPNAISI
ncbi:hydroperoxide isomerase ALOXE3 [Trichonephila clavipes]|nr:hydroperoxide isomerase ALOXE3 [Trichonephila clavipes]